MVCRCPTCGQSAEYPDRYAGKWHKCIAGCPPYPGSRMVLVAGGTGILESTVDDGWRRAIRRGRLLRWAVALLGVAMASAPWTAPRAAVRLSVRLPADPRVAQGVALAGVALALVAGYAARNYWCQRPPGL